MNQVKGFWENAGLRGILVVIVLIALVAQDLSSGQWLNTVPLLVVLFLITYLFRGWLVENLESVRTAMNVLAIAAVLAAVSLRRFVSAESIWLAIAMVGFVGAYLGCYFWLLSDERVVSVR